MSVPNENNLVIVGQRVSGSLLMHCWERQNLNTDFFFLSPTQLGLNVCRFAVLAN